MTRKLLVPVEIGCGEKTCEDEDGKSCCDKLETYELPITSRLIFYCTLFPEDNTRPRLEVIEDRHPLRCKECLEAEEKGVPGSGEKMKYEFDARAVGDVVWFLRFDFAAERDRVESGAIDCVTYEAPERAVHYYVHGNGSDLAESEVYSTREEAEDVLIRKQQEEER